MTRCAFCRMPFVTLRDAQVMDCSFFSRLRRIYPWLMLDHSELPDRTFHSSERKLLFPSACSSSMCSFSKSQKPALGRSTESDSKSMIDITPHERLLSFSPLMGWKLLRWKRYALISLVVTMTTAGSDKETQSVYLSKCQMLA